MSSHTDGLGCLECGQWVCECESDDDYWKARAEKLEDELKEWMVTAEANEAEVQELKNTNAELRKARGCDEIIFEQLKHKKEKAEAELSTKSLQCERHKEARYQIEQECMKLTKENHDLKAEVEDMRSDIESMRKYIVKAQQGEGVQG